MSTASRYYATVESVKSAVGITGARYDALIAAYIESASQDVENITDRNFIPVTATRYFRWPRKSGGRQTLYLEDQDVLAVTTLQSQAQDSSPVTIPAADFFLEPQASGPPYSRIEIDQSSSSSFASGATPQRSIGVTGRWGYSEDTKPAGALAEALDTSETGVDITNAALIGIGDTILVDSEAMFVSGRSLLTTGTTLNDTLTADLSDVTVTLASGAAVNVGEVITIDSERMLIEDIAGNNLTVQRAYDGSVLAAHTTGATVYASRTLTVERGVNGTTAATHTISTAISKYQAPGDVRLYCLAKAILDLKQGEAGWTGMIAGGEGAVQIRGESVPQLRHQIIEQYGRVTV